ncbi:fructokinase-1-like isoform X2 [Prosopis cineraria]|uniref:fructokinase-1-like isoform X2 n=1 Tax=Prosopis cineraria TaxID=364024 RepID=UPI00240FDE44|nr:fructokinase-1-like isoform X2 [Prosopis cineraria]
MSSDSAVPLAGSPIIVGFGGAALDFLAVVAAFPKPDDKIRSTNLKVQGGGNAGNALTCAARLGLKPRIISKVANDIQGRAVLEELEADGVDTFFFVVSEEGCSPFSYVIIDSQAKTRTCIFTAGYPPMMPEDLSRDSLLSALDGARLVYFDGRMHETALLIAREAWTEAASIPRAMVSILLKLPKLKFVIATLGENGSMMLEQCMDDGPQTEEMDVDRSFESLVRQKDDSIAKPTCIATHVTKFRAEGIGSVCGRLYVGTAEKIPPSELIDTNGAGDAFVGAVLYAICNNLSPEKMLPFASCVAAAKCKALGARSGLPRREDPCLASFYNRDPNQ